MTHTARVVSVSPGTPPNVDWRDGSGWNAVTVSDDDDVWQVFWIKADDPAPPVGTIVQYGAHHCWWDGVRVGKTLTRDPNAPLQ